MPSLPSLPLLVDSHGRDVRYLRLSVTDRCNLRCLYCRVDRSFIPHSVVLRFEEIEELVALFVSFGIRKIRLTGGEPFVRKGFTEFLTRLCRKYPHIDFRLTTNGTLLAPHVPLLKELGVGVNLSLDTFHPDRFARITGRDLLHRVRQGMDAMLEAKLPFKLNAVALYGFNNDELPDFLELARRHPVDVRFIEFMPVGHSTLWNREQFWAADDVLAQARKLANLEPVPRNTDTDGPARMFTLTDGAGRFGLITPLSQHFCAACNRLRITSDGRLRTCLFDDREYRLAPILRHPRLGIKALPAVIRAATARKPVGAYLLEQRGDKAVARRAMTSIGG